MPEDIRKGRNIAIVLGIIEFFCCIASIGIYSRERSKIILGMIVLAFIASISGSWAKIRLSWWGLLAHSSFTIAVIGGFYIYSMIDCFFRSKRVAGGGISE